MTICTVVGARPNFMKMAPVYLELKRRGYKEILVHTGQHYDPSMSQVFFDELHLPSPDIFLGVGSGSHAAQTARVMMEFEQVCLDVLPEMVIVGGDVNSTLAGAIVATKLDIPVAHVEAGLRSFDRSMPEEINRIITDHISDLLFTTEKSGTDNLLHEGIAPDKIHMAGNCMIDSLRLHLGSALERMPWESFGLQPGQYGLVTLHRPAAVDDPRALEEFHSALCDIGREITLLFPVHPRTRNKMEEFGLDWGPVRLVEPLGYLDFLGLMARSKLVLTDSGGIQEETTALGVQCVTMRDNTERPVTIEMGTNRLAGTKRDTIMDAARAALASDQIGAHVPPLWDGAAAERIADTVSNWIENRKR